MAKTVNITLTLDVGDDGRIFNGKTDTNEKEVRHFFQYTLMDALAEFRYRASDALPSRHNTTRHVDARYPNGAPGVGSKEERNAKKVDQIKARCRVAGALHDANFEMGACHGS